MSQAKIIIGNVLDSIKNLESESIQTVITSPPYWGLRDYGTATWIGGSNDCDHLGKPMATRANVNKNTGGNDVKNATYREFFKDICGKCGAIRKDEQLGLEIEPDEYIKNMVSVFSQVKRILKNDGTLWLNIGDSYSGSGKGPAGNLGKKNNERHLEHRSGGLIPFGTKPKDLVGIPWMLAFALRNDGWYLRQDIIWHKPNPMPESVTDRCTKSHEYLFLLSKSPKYYFDHYAIRENQSPNTAIDLAKRKTLNNKGTHGGTRIDLSRSRDEYVPIDGKRNKRDVWSIPTKPFKGAHFAVMPEALVEPCILAGSKIGDTVFDPFTGSGTVGLVALRNERNFIGTELNPEYAQIAFDRIYDDAPLLNKVEKESVNG